VHSAATALGAGRDLLQSHFRTDPHGARLDHSGWAPVITSPAIARAQLVEIASLARHAASVAEAPLQADYPLPGASSMSHPTAAATQPSLATAPTTATPASMCDRAAISARPP
jgi:hypothetical protein